MAMRGLTMFITDIRQCATKEEEQKRIDKELGNIRQKFAQTNISGYQLKKYVWKIIYMMMLGIDIDFGHMESVSLISQPKYSEKNVGYVACTLMLTEQNDILRLIIQSVKNDLNSKNENFQCLALTCIANVGGEEFAESLAADVQRLLVSGASRDFVKKKAALCLLRLFRKYPEVIQTDAWAPRFVDMLDNTNLGVVLCVMSLLLGLASYDPEPYKGAVQKCINWLDKLHAKDIDRGYIYYSQGCPWLQVKMLRFFQLYPAPEQPTLYSRLLGQLARLIEDCSKEPAVAKAAGGSSKLVNKSNAAHAVLFETINVIMHYNLAGTHDLLGRAISLLGTTIAVSDPNLRSISLETMARLSKIPGTLDAIKTHQAMIITLLKDTDLFIKKRALDLLFNMCDATNSAEIVMELLTSLADAEYALREEMVLKIAILAENFAMDDRWYIDVILKLIQLAGDFVSNDIWHRVIQVVTNNDNLQAYAAQACYDALGKPKSHETLVKLGGYLLGEFGHMIEEHAPSKSQFTLLHARFATAPWPTQALLLNTFMKMWNLYPHLKSTILKVLQPFRSYIDDELQQRSVEYSEMLGFDNQELMSCVWEMMPPFPERASALVQLMRAKEERAPRKADQAHEDTDEDDEDEEDNEDDDEEGDRHGKSKGKSAASGKKAVSDEDEEESEEEEDDDDEDTEDETESDRSPSPQNTVRDILSIDDLLGGSGAAAAAQTASLAPQDPALPRNILLTGKGVLYECDFLQVGCMVQVDGSPQAKMILYFGNKSTTAPLVNVNLAVPANKGVRAQLRPEGPFSVQPKAQDPLYLLWQVAQPFPALPTAALSLTYQGTPFKLDIALPVAISLFSSPMSISGQGFFDAWQSLSANEHRFMLQSHDGSSFTLPGVAQLVSNSLRLQVVADADPSGQSVVGAGNFAHLGPGGTSSFAPMLLRIEVRDAAMRVTARSNHRIVNAAVESTFKAVF